MKVETERYPALFRAGEEVDEWGSIRVGYVFELETPEPELLSNVRMAAFVGDRMVLITTREGGAEGGRTPLPGGTLDEGEHYLDGVRRELMEEAGARVLGYEVFGRVRIRSYAERPYRPHIPHPEFHWCVGFGDVELVGPPTNPPGGETVISVDLLSVEEAAACMGNDWWRDLVHLAADLRCARMLGA